MTDQAQKTAPAARRFLPKGSDVIGIAGVALILAGVARIWSIDVAMIVGGVMLLLGAIAMVRR